MLSDSGLSRLVSIVALTHFFSGWFVDFKVLNDKILTMVEVVRRKLRLGGGGLRNRFAVQPRCHKCQAVSASLVCLEAGTSISNNSKT